MDLVKEWWVEERVKKTIEKLEAHEFKAIYTRNKEEAVAEIWKYIGPETRVGVGGSMTIRELGILETLKSKGNAVYDHWVPGLSKDQSLHIRRSQLTCDVFLCSVNAISMTGELVNIDGAGNRVSSTVFGPEKVILVVGYQKIANTLEEALKRARDVAASINAKRLKADVPCVKLGKCVDCNSPDRVCRVVVIHERRPSYTDMMIILVGEELGY